MTIELTKDKSKVQKVTRIIENNEVSVTICVDNKDESKIFDMNIIYNEDKLISRIYYDEQEDKVLIGDIGESELKLKQILENKLQEFEPGEIEITGKYYQLWSENIECSDEWTIYV